MQFEIEHKPSYAIATYRLDSGEELNTESGSMVSMTRGLDITTRLNRSYSKGQSFIRRLFTAVWGFFVALMRRIFGGETFFINTFKAKEDNSELILAPALSGDITHFNLQGNKILIQSSSYLASSTDVNLKLRWGGMKTLFGGEGLVLLEASGEGDLFVNSYGGIFEIPVSGRYTVDTGHVVAFDDTLSFKVKRVGGWKSTFFSGEGFVCEFEGQGRLHIQTRQVPAFVQWLVPMLPK